MARKMADLYRKSAIARLSARVALMTNSADSSILTGESIGILRGLNSAWVELINLDPPFDSNQNYAASVGSHAADTALQET